MPLPIEQYLSGYYLAHNPSWDSEDNSWKAEHVLRILAKNHIAPGSAVDVGCGSGGVLVELQKAMPETEFWGFDIAPDAARFWKPIQSPSIHFRLGDYFAFNERRYDLMMMLDVIEHLSNPFEFLAQVRGDANNHVIHFPLDLSAISIARESPLLYVRQKVGHIHYFTKGLAFALLDECGYEIVDWCYTGAAFHAPQRTWKTRLAALPRRIVYALNRDLGVRLLGGETLMVLARPKEGL